MKASAYTMSIIMETSVSVQSAFLIDGEVGWRNSFVDSSRLTFRGSEVPPRKLSLDDVVMLSSEVLAVWPTLTNEYTQSI